MFNKSVIKCFYFFGLKPKFLAQSRLGRLKSVKWTLFHLNFCVILATFLVYYHDHIVSQLNYLGCAADFLKLVTLFTFLFIHFCEVIWKAKNYDLLDKILLEIDDIFVGVGINVKMVKDKAYKRFCTFFLAFFLIYVASETWVMGSNFRHAQSRRFFFAFVYPQVMKYMIQSLFIYYLTIIVIYLEAIHREISQIHTKCTNDYCMVISKLTCAYRKLEIFGEILINTFELSLMAYIMQDTYHIFADLYWLIFRLINTHNMLFWPVFVPKLFVKFSLFYGGQLCVDLVKKFFG